MTAIQVGDINGGKKKIATSNLPNTGGIAGLRANAQAKLKIGVSGFVENVAGIMDHIEAALVLTREGKRVLKGHVIIGVSDWGRKLPCYSSAK